MLTHKNINKIRPKNDFIDRLDLEKERKMIESRFNSSHVLISSRH